MFATMIVFAFFYGITQEKNDLVQQPNFQRFTHENQGDDRLIYQGCERNKKLLFTMFLKCTRCLIFYLSIDVPCMSNFYSACRIFSVNVVGWLIFFVVQLIALV